MARERIAVRPQVAVGLCLACFIVLLAGCGSKKEPVQTDVTGTGAPVQPPVVAEPPATSEPAAGAPAVDYAALEPAAYGIEDVFFAFDVYDLSDQALGTLTNNARIMREHPDLIWLIEGHCDERGTVEYNLALGEKRANVTRDYLMSLGVPAQQLRVTSYGEERPFALGHDEEAWAKNRRSHFARP